MDMVHSGCLPMPFLLPPFPFLPFPFFLPLSFWPAMAKQRDNDWPLDGLHESTRARSTMTGHTSHWQLKCGPVGYPQEAVLAPSYLHLPALMQRCFCPERSCLMFAVMRTAAAGAWHRCRIDKIRIDWIELAVLCNVYIVYIANCGGAFNSMRIHH